MTTLIKTTDQKVPRLPRQLARETAYGYPRNFLERRFVYVVISPRARGLSIGINLNPDRYCNFDCIYCEVNRGGPAVVSELDTEVMARELNEVLEQVHSGQLREHPLYRAVPPELLELKHVTLSGDGEPTLCSKFLDAVLAAIHVRAVGRFLPFKLVLVTNGSGLNRPEVQSALHYLTKQDEIWVKLDVGSQEWMNRINRTEVSLQQILDNILLTARKRPVIIQSLFTSLQGQAPPQDEIERYVDRLAELKAGGAQISQVQIYSATRPTPNSDCDHLPLRVLSDIAQQIRQRTRLTAEVF